MTAQKNMKPTPYRDLIEGLIVSLLDLQCPPFVIGQYVAGILNLLTTIEEKTEMNYYSAPNDEVTEQLLNRSTEEA